MSEEVRVDRVGKITLAGKEVRIELMALDATRRDSAGRPSMTLRQTIVLPAAGFVQLANAALDAMRRLEQRGIVKRRPPAGGAAPAKPAGG
jgi:hypothetical protein